MILLAMMIDTKKKEHTQSRLELDKYTNQELSMILMEIERYKKIVIEQHEKNSKNEER